MSLKRSAVSLLAVVTVALGLGLVVASPAAAARGGWQPYQPGVNPIGSSSWTWVCGDTGEVTTDVLAQVCAIRQYTSPTVVSTRVRVGVIVRNNRDVLYGAEAAGDLSVWTTGAFIDRWICSRSGVAPHTWSVCFGSWINNDANQKVVARGGVNGVNLAMSEQV
jgi:hypothetical protein